MKPFYECKYGKLYHGDCLEVMPKLNEKFDLCLTDPPYGTTACKWDSVIPFEEMWKRLNLLIKENGAIVLFGTEPFSSFLRMSNIDNYRYDWIWEKLRSTGFLNAKKQPMRKTELISVFYRKQCMYNPQLTEKPKENIRLSDSNKKRKNNPEIYGAIQKDSQREIPVDIGYPHNLIKFNKDNERYHPTQKPVALIEYLIKTYTKELETVLDFTMGSGTTAIACINTNRYFVGIEKELEYCEIIAKRLETHLKQTTLFDYMGA